MLLQQRDLDAIADIAARVLAQARCKSGIHNEAVPLGRPHLLAQVP